MLSYFFNSFIYLVGVHSIIFTYIPLFTNNNLDILYNGIILYSKIQHFFGKIYNNIKSKLCVLNIINYKNYFFVKNDNILNIFYDDITGLRFINNNFLLYRDTVINNNIYINNHVFYFDFPIHFIYDCCKFKFISINITLDDNKSYNLKLSDDTNNFFIVNNKLNKYSLSYLLLIQRGISIGNNSYVLDIIDHNVKCFTITEKDELIFNLNTYTIKQIDDKYSIVNNLNFNSNDDDNNNKESDENDYHDDGNDEYENDDGDDEYENENDEYENDDGNDEYENDDGDDDGENLVNETEDDELDFIKNNEKEKEKEIQNHNVKCILA